MILTQENYYSKEADRKYLSVSQFKDFHGTYAYGGCESMAMAKLNGKYETEPSTAMLIGSYVDAYFEGTLTDFMVNTPQIFTNKGDLRADYKQAEQIIAFAEKDELFMRYLVGDGQAQVIVTGEIDGVKWKGKLDRLHKGIAIVDGKVIASIREKIWCPDLSSKINFIDAYGYLFQAAVYQELWYQMSGEKLPFFIAALTKEKVTDKEIIQIPQTQMDMALNEIRLNQKHIVALKNADYPPKRCGKCDYCKSTKMLESVLSYYDL